MPELPEVEVICRGLRANILNKVITNAARLTSFNLRQVIPVDIIDRLVNAQIINVMRQAKYIQVYLDNGNILIIHLGMTGKLLIKDQDYLPTKHDHFIIYLAAGQRLVYNDPRRFGLIDILNTEELKDSSLFKNLGVEPFSSQFSPEYFAKLFQHKKQPIKLALMDNKNFLGIGNIYASESLFLSKISPKRASSSLSIQEITALHHNILLVLNDSIAQGGSTLKDYSTVSGEQGYFQTKFKVYGRDKRPCLVCQENISKIIQAGRSSFYCQSCQM